MRRTPDSISKARQKIKKEIDEWQAGILEAEHSLQLDSASRLRASQKISFGKKQLVECRQKLGSLKKLGKKKFWQKT